MKRAGLVIGVSAFLLFGAVIKALPACIEDKDLDLLISHLEQNIAGQEKSIAALRDRYARIMQQKKQLLDLIEQDKNKLKGKARPSLKTEPQADKKRLEQEKSQAEQKAREAKAKAEEKAKALQAQEETRKKEQAALEKKKQEQTKFQAEQKAKIYQAERERQMELAFDKARKLLESKDINYLDQLIKKQRELCSTIIELQIEITSEEKNLKQLKESREFLANPK